MMGTRQPQKDLFSYNVDLDKRVRKENPLRGIAEQIDFSFVRQEVADRYGYNGNVSEDPAVILKMTFPLFFDDMSGEGGTDADHRGTPGLPAVSGMPIGGRGSGPQCAEQGAKVFQRFCAQIVAQCPAAGLVRRQKDPSASLIGANASKNSVIKGSPEWIAALRGVSNKMARLPDAGLVRMGGSESPPRCPHHRVSGRA